MLYTACSAPIGSAGPRRSAGCGAASCSTSRSRRWRWRRADAAMASVTSIQYTAACLALHRCSVRHSGRTVWRHPPAHFNRHWISMSDSTLVYQDLSPDRILDAVEKTGLHCNGHLNALNRYENRVYQIGLDDGTNVVAKFYRPGRWSDAAILEEHAYALELAEREIPVVAPLRDERGETLHHHDGFRYTLYPRRRRKAHSSARGLPSGQHSVDRRRSAFRRLRRLPHGTRDSGFVDATVRRSCHHDGAARRNSRWLW